MNPLLRFDGVALVRGGRLLFDGLDLTLGPGEALHLIGPNGSGKSSLIRLAAGLLKPQSGSIGASVVALADEHLALDAELPLGWALAFWARLGGSGDRLGKALDDLGLTPLIDIPMRLLSTGQRKRAALARVAASGAPLWLLDEPLNGLDSEGAERLTALIGGHRAMGGAVLAASHLPLAGDWRTLELGQ